MGLTDYIHSAFSYTPLGNIRAFHHKAEANENQHCGPIVQILIRHSIWGVDFTVGQFHEDSVRER